MKETWQNTGELCLQQQMLVDSARHLATNATFSWGYRCYVRRPALTKLQICMVYARHLFQDDQDRFLEELREFSGRQWPEATHRQDERIVPLAQSEFGSYYLTREVETPLAPEALPVYEKLAVKFVPVDDTDNLKYDFSGPVTDEGGVPDLDTIAKLQWLVDTAANGPFIIPGTELPL